MTEELALEVMLAAWPALERERLGDWTLRFSHGFTRRANSVLPLGDPGMPVERAVDRCVRAYAANGLRASFQLRDGLVPEGLVPCLRERGFRAEYPARVLAGPLRDGSRDLRVSQHELPTPEWVDTWVAAAPRSEPGARGLSRPILDGVSRPRTFLLFHEDGVPLGTALGTLSPGWLGLSCLAVHESARLRGVARALLRELTAWARAGGAHRLWLEVEDDNEGALGVYRRLGLEEVGRRYSYLTSPG